MISSVFENLSAKLRFFFDLLCGLDLIFVCFLWIFVYLCGVEFYV